MMTLDSVAPEDRMNMASFSPVSFCPWQTDAARRSAARTGIQRGVDVRDRSKRFMPPSKEPETRMAAAEDTAPDEAGSVLVTAVGVFTPVGPTGGGNGVNGGIDVLEVVEDGLREVVREVVCVREVVVLVLVVFGFVVAADDIVEVWEVDEETAVDVAGGADVVAESEADEDEGSTLVAKVDDAAGGEVVLLGDVVRILVVVEDSTAVVVKDQLVVLSGFASLEALPGVVSEAAPGPGNDGLQQVVVPASVAAAVDVDRDHVLVGSPDVLAVVEILLDVSSLISSRARSWYPGHP